MTAMQGQREGPEQGPDHQSGAGQPSTARVLAGSALSRAVGSWWPLLRLVHRLRWARLRFFTGWRARAVGSRIAIKIAPGATIGRHVRFDALPGTRSRLIIGPNARLGDDLYIQFDGGVCDVGPEVDLRTGVRITCGGHLTVKAGVMISHGAMVHCAERVELDRDAVVSEYSTITDSVHLRTPLQIPLFHHVDTSPVRVGANVWLGAHAVITPGVEVGDGAFVGANAVVTRDVPALWLAAGVPARLIRELTIVDPEP